MSTVFNVALTTLEKEYFHALLYKYTQVTTVCHHWTGLVNKDGYGIVRPTFRGKRVKLTVHRLAYYLHYDSHFLNARTHVSHICHKKTCINILHLSYEPQRINNERKVCVAEGICRRHRGYAECIL